MAERRKKKSYSLESHTPRYFLGVMSSGEYVHYFSPLQWLNPHNLYLAMFCPSTCHVAPFCPRNGADSARQYACKYRSVT